MGLLPTPQEATVLLAFILPVLAYIYYSQSLKTKRTNAAGPLPPPTEITNLFIYPIKSCHSISVPSARLLPTGLDLGAYYESFRLTRRLPSPTQHLVPSTDNSQKLVDRTWMWTTYPDHRFLTIRNLAKMTLIRPTYDARTDTLTVTAPAPNSNSILSFSIPAHPTKAWLAENTKVVDATVWSSTTKAYAYSATLTAGFNDFFGKEVRLVYKPPFSDTPRKLGSNGAEKYLGRRADTLFPDMMPVLVGSEKSILELNERVEKADLGEAELEKGTKTEDLRGGIDVRRCRPNILVKGEKAWDEDRWKTLLITPPPSSTSPSSSSSSKSIILDVTQRCARCHVPNVDPNTGVEHKRQPWDTLMKYRRVDEGIKFKPCFGMLCVPRGVGRGVLLEAGMRMEVTEVTDGHLYIPGF